jgi:hypothetical protein
MPIRITGLSVDVIDLEKVIAGIMSLGQQYINAATVAIQHEAEYEFDLTQDQVPVDTGELKRSGRLEGPDTGMSMTTVSIAYGGPAGSGPTQTKDVDYAFVVHERLDVHHPIGKAKYVEDPVRGEATSGRAWRRMANEIASQLAGIPIKSGAFATKGGSWIRGPRGFRGSWRV